MEEAQNAAAFNLKYPGYLPEGFAFDNAHCYADKDMNVNGLYMDMEFTDSSGKRITVMERLINDETAFKMSTDRKIEQADINGRSAVIIEDGKNIHFETEDNVSIFVSTKDDISKDEMMEVAKSIK